MIDASPDYLIARRLVAELGVEGAHAAVDALTAKMGNVELAALASHWPFWARPKQLPPPGDWVSWGFLTGRGFGKTLAIAKFILGEVEAGRATRIGLCAQNEDKTVEAQVANLIAAAPPWFEPEYHVSDRQLVWPNGARAVVFTPEVPGAIRSENLDLAWLSEIQSWPVTTREEAYLNFLMATRVRSARMVWDATPKRGHPILKRLIARGAAHPTLHAVVRGTIYENPHLARSAVQEMEREYGGTQRGREELEGIMLDESENALVKQAWIDQARRKLPTEFARRVVSVDPAVTARRGSDETGIIDAGLGLDGQGYVIADRSGKHAPSEWADLVLEGYVQGRCDCVVVETNRGGDLVTSNLRAHAGKRGLHVVVLGKEERPRWNPGTVYVREVHARGPKEDRAQPLATAYERGRISHVIGAELDELEDVLTTWEPVPGQKSPDRLDALTHAATELLGLLSNAKDGKKGFVGIEAVAKAIAAPVAEGNLARLLGGHGTGGRI